MKHPAVKSLRLLRAALAHRLDLAITPADVPAPALRWLLRALRLVLPAPRDPLGERLRDCLLSLGPVYIKLGQLLSTRRDLLEPAVADALATLQDRVPPIEDFSIDRFVVRELGPTAMEMFAHIDAVPLASASIAQVHAARLADGTEVVLKIVRPGIEAMIRNDMRHLKGVAAWLDRLVADAYRLHLPRVIRDHEQVLLGELDLLQEGRNQLTLRRNFAGSELLYVPRVHLKHSTRQLLVMERVYGTPIGDVPSLLAQGVDMQRLAHKGVETFFTQVFRHNFFHADMHPGNILIDTTDPADPRYIALDCAIIGSLTEADQNYLAQNLVAFFERDYARVAALHHESGWIPPHVDAAEFERVIRALCDPIFEKPLAEISFGEFVVELFRTAGQFEMEIQPQLVLLQKTLLYIEGLGRQLYPALDLWETAQPFMQTWVAERLNPLVALGDVLATPAAWQSALRLPLTHAQTQRDVRQLQYDLKRLERHTARARAPGQTRRRMGAALAGSGLALLAVSNLNGLALLGLAGTLLGLAVIMRR